MLLEWSFVCVIVQGNSQSFHLAVAIYCVVKLTGEKRHGELSKYVVLKFIC